MRVCDLIKETDEINEGVLDWIKSKLPGGDNSKPAPSKAAAPTPAQPRTNSARSATAAERKQRLRDLAGQLPPGNTTVSKTTSPDGKMKTTTTKTVSKGKIVGGKLQTQPKVQQSAGAEGSNDF